MNKHIMTCSTVSCNVAQPVELHTLVNLHHALCVYSPACARLLRSALVVLSVSVSVCTNGGTEHTAPPSLR